MIRILALYYSQTGQLTRVVRSMTAPLEGRADIQIVWQNLQPKRPYPFPWPFLDFLDVFPESVHMVPPEMEPVSFDPDSHFDLIILAYQVWFLSPSLPITGFLKSSAARVLKDKPVITVIACRNMWLSAQEKGPPWTTFVTTPRWLLTGKKDGFWGIFPAAGVREKDIADAGRFGHAIADSLHLLKSPNCTSLLQGLGAVKVNPSYIASERIAHRSFYIWGKLFIAMGKPGARLRRALLLVYVVFLIAMILTVVPLGALMRLALKPFLRSRLDAEVLRLEQPSGSSTERISHYSK